MRSPRQTPEYNHVRKARQNAGSASGLPDSTCGVRQNHDRHARGASLLGTYATEAAIGFHGTDHKVCDAACVAGTDEIATLESGTRSRLKES